MLAASSFTRSSFLGWGVCSGLTGQTQRPATWKPPPGTWTGHILPVHLLFSLPPLFFFFFLKTCRSVGLVCGPPILRMDLRVLVTSSCGWSINSLSHVLTWTWPRPADVSPAWRVNTRGPPFCVFNHQLQVKYTVIYINAKLFKSMPYIHFVIVLQI